MALNGLALRQQTHTVTGNIGSSAKVCHMGEDAQDFQNNIYFEFVSTVHFGTTRYNNVGQTICTADFCFLIFFHQSVIACKVSMYTDI